MDIKDISVQELLDLLIDRCYKLKNYPELYSIKELEEIVQEIKERKYKSEYWIRS